VKAYEKNRTKLVHSQKYCCSADKSWPVKKKKKLKKAVYTGVVSDASKCPAGLGSQRK